MAGGPGPSPFLHPFQLTLLQKIEKCTNPPSPPPPTLTNIGVWARGQGAIPPPQLQKICHFSGSSVYFSGRRWNQVKAIDRNYSAGAHLFFCVPKHLYQILGFFSFFFFAFQLWETKIFRAEKFCPPSNRVPIRLCLPNHYCVRNWRFGEGIPKWHKFYLLMGMRQHTKTCPKFKTAFLIFYAVSKRAGGMIQSRLKIWRWW